MRKRSNNIPEGRKLQVNYNLGIFPSRDLRSLSSYQEWKEQIQTDPTIPISLTQILNLNRVKIDPQIKQQNYAYKIAIMSSLR